MYWGFRLLKVSINIYVKEDFRLCKYTRFGGRKTHVMVCVCLHPGRHNIVELKCVDGLAMGPVHKMLGIISHYHAALNNVDLRIP